MEYKTEGAMGCNITTVEYSAMYVTMCTDDQQEEQIWNILKKVVCYKYKVSQYVFLTCEYDELVDSFVCR